MIFGPIKKQPFIQNSFIVRNGSGELVEEIGFEKLSLQEVESMIDYLVRKHPVKYRLYWISREKPSNPPA